MPITHKTLRMYRKRSRLTQANIAFLMQISDYSHISRWEKGERNNNQDLLIVYQMLFNTPSQSLFELENSKLSNTIIDRIKLLIGQLELQEPTQKVVSRITFLKSVLSRDNQ